MGVVYLAHQSFPERKVALKLLSPELASDPAFRERFVHESNAAASTEHPNIVPVYGPGRPTVSSTSRCASSREPTSGRSSNARVRLSPERAARICAEIADALEAAHDRGLIHRDVKPGNILLDSRDRAYLTDFGLIRRTQLHTDITKTGQFMGTVDYCAPEQIKGGEIDGRADVYSLGCVLFECLTGAPPFRKDTEVATIYAHLEEDVAEGELQAPRDLALLSSVVTKAMAKRPEDRFATAGEMAEALRGSHGEGPAEAAVVRRGWRWRSSQPRRSWSSPALGTTEPRRDPPAGTAATRSRWARSSSSTRKTARSCPRPPVAPQRMGRPARRRSGRGRGVVSSTGTSCKSIPPSRSNDVVTDRKLADPSLALAERIVWAASATGVARVAASDLKVLREIKLVGARGSRPST